MTDIEILKNILATESRPFYKYFITALKSYNTGHIKRITTKDIMLYSSSCKNVLTAFL